MNGTLQQKIKQAKDQSKGQPKEAEKLLLAWVKQDPSLLQVLVEPFLPGLIAHALNHGTEVKAPTKSLKPQNINSVGMDGLINQLSANIGASVPKAGTEKTIRAKASSRHEDAIRILAKAHQDNKK